jgi:hypothetical protein
MFIYALQSGKRGPSQSIFGQSWQSDWVGLLDGTLRKRSADHLKSLFALQRWQNLLHSKLRFNCQGVTRA